MVADGDRPTVLSVQKYESGPPVPTSHDQQLISDPDTIATTKQEEWVTKKRVELTTTKQIETRVKRQVVLEDGKVIDDSGPIVTTTTTEDTDKNESEHTEHLTQGEDDQPGEGWVAVEAPPEEAVIKETNERKITTHDELEDILETEQVQHLGDVSNDTLSRAIRDGDARKGIREGASEKKALTSISNSVPKRILQQSRKHDRTTDIEDTKEVSRMKENGNVVTEITRRHEHEEFHNEDIPDSDSDEFEHIETRDGNHDYSHAKNEDFIEYLAVPKGAKLSQGVKVGDGAHIVSENVNSRRQGDEDLWDSVSERIRKSHAKAATAAVYNNQDTINNKLNFFASNRSDALTNRPLDLDQEEYTRKNETNRWLNSHFGSSSSSLNSDSSPRSPIHSTPTGIHVTMTSRSSPINSPPPPPPMPGGGKFFSSRIDSKENLGKRISFGDSPRRQGTPVKDKDVHFDLKHRHEDVMRSLNSHVGRVSTLPKTANRPWDEEPTPTPPPRSRRRHSPDAKYSHNRVSNGFGNMHRKTFNSSSPDSPSYLQKSNDIGERKSYERREQSFGYNGANTPHRLESGNFDESGYVTKHSNYYKTNETNNPAQNATYENGEAEVTERRTVERRQQTFSYDGAPQKQFHPKYIVGMPSSTMNRLKGIEHTGAVVEDVTDRHSQTLPRRRFYFGDDQGSLMDRGTQRSTPAKELRFGSSIGGDDINVSILNKYNGTTENARRSSSLNRSMSFTPRSMSLERPAGFSTLSSSQKHRSSNKSNPQLTDGPDLLSPRLITNISRGGSALSGGYYRGSKASSPARSMTPTGVLLRSSLSDTNRGLAARYGLNSPRNQNFGGTSSPMSDDYQELYRMSASTPDQEETGRPKITTDTTSKFSRRTLRGNDGQPAGKVESSETTTRTKSRFKESEIMYPNGRRVGSPGGFSDFQPQLTSAGSVIIPVRDASK